MRPIELALYTESMQRVSECELVVFCGPAARPAGGRAHPLFTIWYKGKMKL